MRREGCESVPRGINFVNDLVLRSLECAIAGGNDDTRSLLLLCMRLFVINPPAANRQLLSKELLNLKNRNRQPNTLVTTLINLVSAADVSGVLFDHGFLVGEDSTLISISLACSFAPHDVLVHQAFKRMYDLWVPLHMSWTERIQIVQTIVQHDPVGRSRTSWKVMRRVFENPVPPEFVARLGGLVYQTGNSDMLLMFIGQCPISEQLITCIETFLCPTKSGDLDMNMLEPLCRSITTKSGNPLFPDHLSSLARAVIMKVLGLQRTVDKMTRVPDDSGQNDPCPFLVPDVVKCWAALHHGYGNRPSPRLNVVALFETLESDSEKRIRDFLSKVSNFPSIVSNLGWVCQGNHYIAGNACSANVLLIDRPDCLLHWTAQVENFTGVVLVVGGPDWFTPASIRESYARCACVVVLCQDVSAAYNLLYYWRDDRNMSRWMTKELDSTVIDYILANDALCASHISTTPIDSLQIRQWTGLHRILRLLSMQGLPLMQPARILTVFNDIPALADCHEAHSCVVLIKPMILQYVMEWVQNGAFFVLGQCFRALIRCAMEANQPILHFPDMNFLINLLVRLDGNSYMMHAHLDTLIMLSHGVEYYTRCGGQTTPPHEISKFLDRAGQYVAAYMQAVPLSYDAVYAILRVFAYGSNTYTDTASVSHIIHIFLNEWYNNCSDRHSIDGMVYIALSAVYHPRVYADVSLSVISEQLETVTLRIRYMCATTSSHHTIVAWLGDARDRIRRTNSDNLLVTALLTALEQAPSDKKRKGSASIREGKRHCTSAAMHG